MPSAGLHSPLRLSIFPSLVSHLAGIPDASGQHKGRCLVTSARPDPEPYPQRNVTTKIRAMMRRPDMPIYVHSFIYVGFRCMYFNASEPNSLSDSSQRSDYVLTQYTYDYLWQVALLSIWTIIPLRYRNLPPAMWLGFC